MSAGTIKLTNGSTAVVGTGTTFTSELKSGDVITATVGGIFFTLFVDAVTSNTALTLTDPFTGPTTSGLAWVAVPQLTLNRITAALAAQTAESVRRVLQENANWQAFYTGTGDITVTLPDGTPAGRPVSGPSWTKIAGITASSLQWRGGIPASSNLNNFGPTTAYTGAWGQSSVSATAADVANGYPAAERGVLEVFAGGRNNCTQRYTTDGGRFFIRWLAAAWNAASPSWADWIEIGGLSSNTVLSSSVTSLSDATAFAQNQTYVLAGIRTDSPVGLTAGQNNAIIMSVRRGGGTIMGLHQTLFTAVGTYERYGAPNAATGWTSVSWYNGGDANGWRLIGADAMSALGYGLSMSTLVTTFDWQQADFPTGSMQCAQIQAMANTPPGITVNSTTSVTIHTLQNRGTLFVVKVTPLTSTIGNKKEYTVVINGAKGSRTFQVTQNFNDDTSTVIPIVNGGTGATTAAASRTALGVAYGSTAGTVVQGNDARLNNLQNFDFNNDGTASAQSGWSVKSKAATSWGSLLTYKGAYFLNDFDAGSSGSFYSLVSSRSSNGSLASAAYHLGVAGPTPGKYGEMYMAGLSDSGSVARLSIQCSRSDVYFVTGSSTTPDTYALNKTIVSDRTLKDDIVYSESAANEALANIDAMQPTTFIFKNDEQRRERRGVIAQDLQEISAEYVKKMEWQSDEGEHREQLRLDNNALLVDALLAIHALSIRVKDLEAKLSDNPPAIAGPETVESEEEYSPPDGHKTE